MVDGVAKYGGDFEGELTNDGNFCCDGLVFADRSFKAGTMEAKAAFQPIRTSVSYTHLDVYKRQAAMRPTMTFVPPYHSPPFFCSFPQQHLS